MGLVWHHTTNTQPRTLAVTPALELDSSAADQEAGDAAADESPGAETEDDSDQRDDEAGSSGPDRSKEPEGIAHRLGHRRRSIAEDAADDESEHESDEGSCSHVIFSLLAAG